jgi:hypothetical protein
MIVLILFFTLALAGAALEGLWTAMPPSWVQFNGLVLILSALGILTGLLRNGRTTRPIN